MTEMTVQVGGLRMPNPVMLASWILGETGKSLLRVHAAGAGAVVTKSIGCEPREGHRNPTFLEVAGGYINAMGLPNPGLEEYSPEVMQAVAGGAIVIASVYGRDVEEYAVMATRMQEYGTRAIELNLSCPHASGTGMELGTDPRMVADITAAVKGVVAVPVFVKLTPNITDIRDIADAAASAGADAVVAVNTLKAMAIDAGAMRPILGNIVGGFSGPALKYIGLRMVWDIYRMFHGLDESGGSAGGGGGGRDPGGRIPSIIGVGGVETGKDAAEYILAGADAVQVGSAVVDGGPGAPGRIARELEEWMEAHRFGTPHQFRGLAHKSFAGV